jgi:hypothetical protein
MEDPEGQSMFNAIDTSKVRCLNESAAGSCVHPFKPYSRVSARADLRDSSTGRVD